MLNGTTIFNQIAAPIGKPQYKYIAKLNYINQGKVDPPLNMNVHPNYVSDELKRNVFIFLFLF